MPVNIEVLKVKRSCFVMRIVVINLRCIISELIYSSVLLRCFQNASGKLKRLVMRNIKIKVVN